MGPRDALPAAGTRRPRPTNSQAQSLKCSCLPTCLSPRIDLAEAALVSLAPLYRICADGGGLRAVFWAPSDSTVSTW